MKPNGTRARAHDEGLTLAQQNAVDLIAAGATDTEAAQKLNLNRVTVTRWRCYSRTSQRHQHGPAYPATLLRFALKCFCISAPNAKCDRYASRVLSRSAVGRGASERRPALTAGVHAVRPTNCAACSTRPATAPARSAA